MKNKMFGLLNYEQTALVLALSLVLLLVPAGPLLAHGVKFNYQMKTSYEIEATYDDGTPMSGAQVSVYAPSDPANPWITGIADENGRYLFTPDPAIAGQWAVQVRQAGHGGILNIPVGTNTMTAVPVGSSFSPAQLAVMIIAVLWGFAGTALFFKKRRS